MTDPLHVATQERDYYRSLLSLATCDDPQQLVDSALRLLVAIVGAREGYIELSAEEGAEVARWAATHGCDEPRIDEIRHSISRGIVAEAIATGQVVFTSSAILDPRFRDLESVRDRAIDAVVCGPIGAGPPLGHVYLQGLDATDEELTPSRVVEHVRLFTASLAPIAERALHNATSVAPASARHLPEDAFDALVARSAAMRAVVQQLRFVAPLDVTLLLTGPTGTGKSLLAAAVHAAGPRAARRFVEVNCAAIPDALFENEIFGADPGGHSAAVGRPVPGKLELAEGGTLFLDEVAELSLQAQAKLLQLLQSRTYHRLGGRDARRADVRFLAATHVDLATAVAEGRFREDLYFRLNVVDVRVPPLRERAADIVPLAWRFVEELCSKERWSPPRLAPSALRALSAAEWPGNVRELGHAVVRGTLRCKQRTGECIDVADLFPNVTGARERHQGLHDATRDFQRDLIASTLRETDWNVAETARRLEIARSHLYDLIRTFGLRRT